MRCEDIRELLSEYMDNRLDAGTAASIKEHVASCGACREELEALEEAKAMLGNKEKVGVPLDMDYSFLKKLNEVAGPAKVTRSFTVYYKKALAMAATAAILFVVVSQTLSVPMPVVSGAQGTVKVFLANKNEWVMVDGNMRVHAGDIIKTFQNSQTDIAVKGVCSMRLKSNTEMTIDQLGSRITKADIRYTLAKGKALIYHNQKTLKNNAFRIETPESLNTAIGTDFMVASLPEARMTWVGVMDGSVMVKPLANAMAGIVVNAGQKTEVTAGAQTLSATSLADEEWSDMLELYQIGVKPQVALLISTGENRVRELLRPCPLYVSDRRDSPIPAMLRETVSVFNRAIKEKDTARHLEAISKFEDIITTYPSKQYNVQFLLFIGAYHNYLGQYEDAIDTFERVLLQYQDSRLASIAQCAIAIIYEERLNSPEKAKEAYQKVILKYPNSPEASFAKKHISN